jgi:hypothetical protein
MFYCGGQNWLCPEANLDVMLKEYFLKRGFWQKFLFITNPCLKNDIL